MALVDAARAAIAHLDALAASLRDVASAAMPNARAGSPSASVSEQLLDELNRNQNPELVRALGKKLGR